MKQSFYIISMLFLLSCFGKKPGHKTGHEGKPMPSVNLLLTDSTTTVNTENIPTGEPIIFIYFSPSCPYCNALVNEITGNIKKLSDIKFYFISAFPIADMQVFYKEHNLQQYPNITVGQDYTSFFLNHYKIPVVPYLVFLNKNKILNQVIIGKISTERIKNTAFE